MDGKKISERISGIAAAAVTLITLLKGTNIISSPIFDIVFWVVFGVGSLFILASVIALLVFIVKERKNAENRVDTTSILRRSKKVAKDLRRVVEEVDSLIQKHVRSRDTWDETRKVAKNKAVDSISLIASTLPKKEGKKAKNTLGYLASLEAKAVRASLRKEELPEASVLSLNQAVLASIKDIQRALLVLEQYDTRVFLGDYLLRHDANVLDCADALIDYKGWTYSLLGKEKKFVESVEKGIALLEDYQKKDLDETTKKAVALRLARAHRHLGSDVALAKKDPSAAIHHNELGKDIVLKAFPKKEWTSPKVKEMLVGLDYGIANAKLFSLSAKSYKEHPETLLKEALEGYEEAKRIAAIASTFENPHRYVKCVLLQNEFLKAMEPGMESGSIKKNAKALEASFGEGDDLSARIRKAFDDNTKAADRVFGRAIYADEMMEIYINQEISELFRRISDIAEKR